MLRHVKYLTAIFPLIMLSTACGGSDDEPAQSAPVAVTPPPLPPSPPPQPPPPPPVFTAVAGQIFADPQNTSGLALMGRGWSHDYVPNGSAPATNIRDAGDIAASFDAAANVYKLTIPLLGSGILYQTAKAHPENGVSEFYGATIASSANEATTSPNKNALLVLRPGVESTFKDVAWIEWFADQPFSSTLRTSSHGVFGLARPSPVSALPTSGSVGYTSHLKAYIGGNVADLLTGVGGATFDFSTSSLSGSFDVYLQCFMGCGYPPVTYQIANATYNRGSLSFSGELVAQNMTDRGTFSGTFAGPTASEILISFEAPYFDPDRKLQVVARGIILGRR